MTKNILFYYIVIVMIVFASCSKFLDVNPSTTTVNPTTIKDFKEMLNGDSLATSFYFLLDLMSDDAATDTTMYNSQSTYYTRTYLWNDTLWNATDDDFIYTRSYTRILQMNIILSRIDKAVIDSENTELDKNLVISQALINRASYYLQLANIYGPTYSDVTATTDLTVPLVLDPQSGTLPARATAKDMYTQIVTDLRKAVNNQNLPAKGVDMIHPGKAAGYTLLARTYLYEGKYDSAQLFADSSLLLASTLMKYTSSTTAPTQLLDLSTNPEILLARGTSEDGYYTRYGDKAFRASQELTDSLGSADFRLSSNFSSIVAGSIFIPYRPFYQYIYAYYYKSSGSQFFFNCSIGVSEAMLIKAECLARNGDVANAGLIIDNIRSNRLSSVSTRNYTSGNILSYVLWERRKELMFHGGLRLFDLKRLNKETATQKTMYRYYNGINITTITKIDSLLPNSPKYLLPFSATVIANNTNIVQNPR